MQKVYQVGNTYFKLATGRRGDGDFGAIVYVVTDNGVQVTLTAMEVHFFSQKYILVHCLKILRHSTGNKTFFAVRKKT